MLRRGTQIELSTEAGTMMAMATRGQWRASFVHSSCKGLARATGNSACKAVVS